MKVIVDGLTGNKKKRITYSLLDRYDTHTQTSSMARSTGYTATAGVRLLINQLFTAKGVFPPEKIGSSNACFEYVLKHLKERNVVWKMEEQQIQ